MTEIKRCWTNAGNSMGWMEKGVLRFVKQIVAPVVALIARRCTILIFYCGFDAPLVINFAERLSSSVRKAGVNYAMCIHSGVEQPAVNCSYQSMECRRARMNVNEGH